jgi:hypothetical protein
MIRRVNFSARTFVEHLRINYPKIGTISDKGIKADRVNSQL